MVDDISGQYSDLLLNLLVGNYDIGFERLKWRSSWELSAHCGNWNFKGFCLPKLLVRGV